MKRKPSEILIPTTVRIPRKRIEKLRRLAMRQKRSLAWIIDEAVIFALNANPSWLEKS